MKTNRWATLLDNQVVAIVVGLLLAVPLLFGAPGAQRSLQFTAYGMLGLLLLAVWLFRAHDRITLEKVRSLATSGPNLPILLYVVWGLLSVALSSDAYYSQYAFVQLAFGALIYAMVVYQFRHQGQVQTLLVSLLGLGALVVIGAFVLDADRHLVDLAGSFHDRQLFGAFLGLLLPVLLGVAAGTRNRAWKMGAQLSAILLAAALVLTRCRSSWLGVVVALAVFAVLSGLFVWKWEELKKQKHRLVIAPLMAVVVLGFGLGFSRLGGPALQRAASVSSLGEDASVLDRLHLWGIATRVIAARPITGWGAGTYAVAQRSFNPQSRSQQAIRKGPSLSESPHNTYLQIAAEQGLVGLGLYLWILGAFFITGIRSLSRMSRGLRKYTLIGCLAAVGGQCVDAFSNPGWMFPEVSTFFWLVLGLGMCAAGLGQAAAEERAPASSEEPVLGVPRFLYRGVRTAAIGCATLFLGAQLLNLNTMGAAFAQAPAEPFYEDGDRDGDGDGLGTGEAVGIGIGSAAVGYGVAAATGGSGGGAAGEEDEEGNPDQMGTDEFSLNESPDLREKLAPLPAGQTQITALRLTPVSTRMERGRGRVFHLAAKSAEDGKWYSVTQRGEATFRLRGARRLLSRHAGTKNAFFVPASALRSNDGKTVILVGTFAPEGEKAVSTTSRIQVHVPAAEKTAGTRSGRGTASGG